MPLRRALLEPQLRPRVATVMLFVTLALLQATSAPPDIELHATVRARSLTIEKQGKAEIRLTADGQNLVDVQAPKANGRKTIASPGIKVDVEARIADPAAPAASAQPRD